MKQKNQFVIVVNDERMICWKELEVFDSLSHELRTPVVTIKAYIDMLLQDQFGELRPEQKEKLERVKENTDLLIKVISEMLEKSMKLK